MTLTPSSLPGSVQISQPNHRAAGLARALGARKARGRFFLSTKKAAQFTALYQAGFWATGPGRFRRDPRALDLYGALAVARIPLDGISGLTAISHEANTEPKTTD